ncbi:MAG TPA: hypothetical protein VN150_10980 [Ochrobactrum sp.]|nr:hypothetical protein [Ochrobactrum sp.]
MHPQLIATNHPRQITFHSQSDHESSFNAIERIKTENCDYEDLGFSAEITKSMRENALPRPMLSPMLLDDRKPPKKG